MNTEYQRLRAEASEVQNQIDALLDCCGQMAAAGFHKLEADLVRLHQKLTGLRQGMALLKLTGSRKMQEQAAKLAKSQPKKFYSQGVRAKTVRLTGGVTVTLHITYYHRFKCPAEAKNKKTRRGMYPMLILLGIAEGFTAGVRQRMMKCAALLGSYEEAVQMLADEGIRICVNTLRKVTAGMGEMLTRLTKLGSVKISGNAAGRRIVVTTDGGRARIREKRRGKTKKGYKRFKPAWREPRLFMIYATDEHGRLDPTFPPIIDGTMGSCDQLFRLLLSYLKGLNVKEAAKVQFIADGAAWIWKRVPSLIASLGLTPEQTHQRIDYWHAVEYLGKIVESSSLQGKPKTQWLKTQKNRLYRGEIGTVVIAIQELIGDKPSDDQKTWLNYFENHGLTHRRMDYSVSVSNHLPIGSGAIESAVRRVINLRVKSNATYWLRENAETIIRFRAWIKAGRAEELFQQTTYVTPELVL
jgi:hypothetical protein